MGIRIFHRDEPALMVPMISRDARFIVWPGTGATTSIMNYVVLEPGEGNIPHHHATSEDCVFILEGQGSVQDVAAERLIEFNAGDAIFIPPGLQHGTLANRGQRVVSVGGPTPPDMEMLKLAGADI